MSDKQGAPALPPLAGGGGNNGGSNGGAPQQTVSLQQVFAQLTSSNVQQFVLASPGLTQVQGNQSIGVTRIVNLSGATPRVSVVNVPSSSGGGSGTTGGSTLTSPGRQNPKLVLTTSPKLVRTSIANMFVTPTPQTASSGSSSTGQSPPAKKKLRLAEGEKPTEGADALGYRRRIMEHKLKRMRTIREKYNENASELFFLHNGGNLMDYCAWRKKPPTAQYQLFMKQHRLEADGEEETLQNKAEVTTPVVSVMSTNMANTTTTTTTITTTITTTTTTLALATMTTATTITSNTATLVATTAPTQSTEVAVSGGTPVAVSTTLPPAVAQLNQQGGTPIVIDSSKSSSTPTGNPVVDKVSAANPVDKPATPPIPNSQPIVKLVKLPASSIASPCDTTVSNQEQIVEKAKQEAYVMQRIAELQREGLWSERRLPKVQEPNRTKAHWDYLLEEMVWLSADFAQERKWKKSAAKKCARMVQKYFQEKAIQAQKAEKLEELRLKKIAGFIAKEIKTFWANVEKLVEYKQQTRLDEKRKKALDQHLNFIVDQTEKYSSWLTEGLNKTEGTQSTSASIHSSRISSPVTAGKHSDDDFKPNQDSDDDEETIAKAEEEMKSNHKEEVELLKKESELPLEDLLKELPPNYLEERDKSLSPLPREVVEEENDNAESKDAEFTVASDESSEDEEDTIQEQEKLEKNVDHKQELEDLEAEKDMPIDELMAKYGNAAEAPMEVDDSDDEESDKDKEEEEDEDESESENETESEDETQDDSQTQSDDETAIGLKSLLEDLSDENKSIQEASEKQNEMDSVAALAESIQPKGNTLLTTSVVTKIPFLLKHCLREYQHIGLDWLVTMFERKLNGILADEMGLGKTIQTIALLAHLACEKGNWGPHLIIVPTSVMLNWEMECKKWCPGFKILTYYGTQKERKQKRTGWTKPNAFHICITSYKLVIQDHQSFRRKKWKYLILDEAQNIKNFKSQRWQLLLNFQTQRRLLLTGTPLQNNLMELWSLMHFLMPNVFQSHREFKEWFSNPVTGMIEGNNEYNENIIRRLHKVLRPFLLRRLKCEVEKQLPKKYEHVIMCRLSKRQRYLYDDFMSRAKTKETLASGNLLSVINVLMQLRKVCNHPNLFESRPTVSPFQMEGIEFHTASLAWSALNYDPFKHVDLSCLNLLLVDLEFVLTAFVAHKIRKLKTPRKLIEEIDNQPDPPPRCPPGKIKINVRLSNQVSKSTTATQQSPQQIKIKSFPGILPTPRVGTSPLVKNVNSQTPTGQGAVTLKVAGGQQLQGFSVQLVPHQGGVKAIPVGTVAQNVQSTATVTPTTTAINTQRITVGNSNTKDGPQRLTTHTYTVKHGDSVQKYPVPSFAQLVQTSTGRHIILTNPNQQTANAFSFPVMTSSGQRLTVLSKQFMGLSTPVSVNKVIGGVVTTSSGGITGRPVMRVPPLNVSTSQAIGQVQPHTQIRCGVVTRNAQKDEKIQTKEIPKSEFYLPQLEEIRRHTRQTKLATLADINERRCAACPLYGEDLFTALRIGKPATECPWHSGWLHCASKNEPARTKRQYFSRTEALAQAIKSTEQIVQELQEIFDRFVIYVPAVRAPLPRFHVSHPPPYKLWKDQRLEIELQRHLSPKVAVFHSVTRSMLTQFPDARLIQYDCGKLQSLDLLLRDLKTNGHRVLIFTQMTRMLDVLEAFLNYHGYIYLRLDGATRVDQRQVLMERFNNDKRIFCFILSTRSGGVGVNLTGADTVVFYDSDWNPTMDAQAQDRCHRIGQTRDVHIYRLISERTIEENILKKANQKRLLGDLAIEGGNFTTAYFKSSTIQDLFNVDQSENDATARMAEVLEQTKERERHLQREMSQTEDKMAIGALESALAAVEEDLDVQAAKTAKAEAVADLAEFDENIPVEDPDNNDAEVSKAELEVQSLVSQLTPVERYAMRFVEESDGNFSAAQLAAAERELEEQKKEWEMDRLRALREEEERQMRMTDDDENPLTFAREDAQNQVNNSSSNSRRVSSKRPARPVNRQAQTRRASARGTRRRISRRSNRIREDEEEETSSESESETTSLTDTDSRNDDVASEQENSSDEELKSSKEGSSDVDDDAEEEEEEEEEEREEEEGEEDGDNEEDSKSQSGRRQVSFKNLLSRTKKNHFDLNSPRTRSRGNVKINLWTLDESPILPESKPRHRMKKKTEKPDESFAMPLPPDDNRVVTLADSLDNSITKSEETSVISSADESMGDEEESDKTTNSTLISPTNRTATKTTSKLNLRSSEKGTEVEEPMSLESKTKNDEVVKESLTSDSKDSGLTHHRPGRPRKQSQSLAAASAESNTVMYSTRSYNKLSSVRSLQEKKNTVDKINCKGEPEICDINDTSNPRNDYKEKEIETKEESSSIKAMPVEASIRPKGVATSEETGKDHKEESSVLMVESYENVGVTEQNNSNSLEVDRANVRTNFSEEIRSSSPVFSTRRTRSLIKNRTESKDEQVDETATSDSSESKQIKLPEKTADEELVAPMGIEDPEENAVPLVEATSTHKSSPTLSTKQSKVTRSSVRFSADVKEKSVMQEFNIEAKDKHIIVETGTEETKSVKKRKDTEVESTISSEAESDNSLLKTTNKEADHEQVKIITRSSTRSTFDSKPKEKNSTTPGVLSEQPKSSVDEAKDLETLISVPTVEVDKISISEKKSNNEERQPTVQRKITRFFARTSGEPQTKISKMNSNVDAADSKLSKSVTEKSEVQASLKHAIVDISSKQIKPALSAKSPERSTKEPIVSSQENSANEVNTPKEVTAPRDTKAPPMDLAPSGTPELKSAKTAKTDTLISGVMTRRSKFNYNEKVSEITPSNTETKVTSIENKMKLADTVEETQLEKSIVNVNISAEQSRVTRSNMQVPNPLNKNFSSSPKHVMRRRPDTPMPVTPSVRPLTRSLANNSNLEGEGSSLNNQYQLKLSPRSSKTAVENSFLVPSSPPVTVRRSRSTTYIKMSERLAMERKEIPASMGATKGQIRDPVSGESLTINRLIKRRPDTPLPTPEQFSRIGKTNVDFYMPAPKNLPPMPKLKQIRKAVAIPQPVHAIQHQSDRQHQNSEMNDSTDSNGNSLDSDSESSSRDKPQRTAKVVAILSLDSKNMGKSTSHQQVTSPSQRAKLHNAENTVVNNLRPPRLRSAHAGKISSNNTDDDDSSPVVTVDLDNEPDYGGTSDESPRLGKRVKRSRLSQLAKPPPLTSIKSLPGKQEIQTIEIEDDEDEKM